MSFVSLSKREINLKVVYYGPPLCGKTTNLEQIHAAVPPDVKGQMTMLSTRQDRTLYFDFLPLRSDVIKGFVSRFQLYTVPGQTIYNHTRKIVLTGVDGVVFVADSQWEVMEQNAESFQNLQDNLTTFNRTLDQIPYILQFNKRDLPNRAPVEYMDFLLNSQREERAAYMEAVAASGQGVLDTLNIICKMVLARFIEENHMAAAEVGDEVAVAAKGT
jgi:signal recognition particle receptor subunit beta